MPLGIQYVVDKLKTNIHKSHIHWCVCRWHTNTPYCDASINLIKTSRLGAYYYNLINIISDSELPKTIRALKMFESSFSFRSIEQQQLFLCVYIECVQVVQLLCIQHNTCLFSQFKCKQIKYILFEQTRTTNKRSNGSAPHSLPANPIKPIK